MKDHLGIIKVYKYKGINVFKEKDCPAKRNPPKEAFGPLRFNFFIVIAIPEP